ncbi:interleukin-1 receptor-like 1 [Etheostoma spectabile]|uniref:interleukin-1 receptor-like 1 n=1 Tax=Etheostoma spectabile TaxID=54343 RepID=UPI0013AEC293|nr:interleukin-1 receptor-like 1 [Etheostoma spectabile]
MDTSRLLFLIFVVITTSECSGTAKPKCKDMENASYTLSEGEAFYFEPSEVASGLSNEEITWYKNEIENITTDKNENVHYRGEGLFFLNLLPENSGTYTAWEKAPPGNCYKYDVEVNVVKPSQMKDLLYGEIKNSDTNKRIPCPNPVKKTCQKLKGKFTWKKDNKPLQGHHKDDLWINNATKDDEGIYTCICTWTYNGKQYNSSASRELKVEEKVAIREIMILSPIDEEQLADEGVGLKLNCSIFCGTTKESDCDASWMVDGLPFHQLNGYNQTTNTIIDNSSRNTISTAILTIEKVSANHFKTEFKCIGQGMFKASATLTLRRRESVIPLVTGAVCVLFFVVSAAVLVKCFAIDLILFFRPYFPLSSYNKDGKVYDAYVVYHMQSMDKATEDTLCQFVTQILPSVLEKKCGYRLFIHGRDDVPGEDRLELVEERMKQSRRLMVILTPGSGSELQSTDQRHAAPQNAVIGEFDWQVGLHHALFQREMSVILVQLGDTGPQEYTHLSAGLQHLILKSAPIKWPEGSRGAAAWNSRFWKRVRYLMPAIPAIKCPQSDII